MQKRWFAFCEHARGGVSSGWPTALRFLALTLAGACAVPCLALTGAEFLALPAADLEAISKEPRVGDRVLFRVTLPQGVESPKSVASPPAVTEEASKEATSDSGWQLEGLQTDSSGALLLSARAVKSGKLTLSSLALEAEAGPVARTHPVTVDVASVIDPQDPSATKAAELQGPASLPYPGWVQVLLGALGALAFAALAFLIWRLMKNRKLRPAALPELPPKSEDELAILALDELAQKGWLAQGQYKKHYFRVSEILKIYLGARYDFDAPERTSTELVGFMEEHRLASDRILDQLESLFDRMDRVKFTDHVPAEADGTQILKEVRELVTLTRRLPMASTRPLEVRR
jgi:hypothetical protein